MNGCTNVRMYECTNERMNECTNVRMYECTNVRMYECMNVCVYECMSDSERLRGTPCRVCVCGVSSLSSVSVCVLFHVRCVARGLTALAFASTPSLRERPRFATRHIPRTHTLPTSVRAGPGSRATCSPLACLGTKVASAGGVSPCLADFLAKGFLLCAVQTNARSGGGAHTLAGCIPTHLVALIPSRAACHLNRDSHDHKKNSFLPD